MLVLVLMGLVLIGAVLDPMLTLGVVIGVCIAFYAAFALLKLVVTVAGRGHQPLERIPLTSRDRLPRYGILLPVYHEANMLPQLVGRVGQLDYPTELLRAYLLIEADDEETLAAARGLGLRFHGDGGGDADTDTDASRIVGRYDHFRVVVIPPGGPKTKPNAMNAAMPLLVAEGCKYLTIYDAEDRPEPDQLLKAVGTFRAAPRDIACVQSELEFWNDDTNWITALYWIGYKVHFRRFLPGLARLGLPVPLGGTSNHFRVSALLDAALPNGDVWDPHNLTEDADLAARLVSAGYRIELLSSVTLEEAPVSIRVVDKQQRRWKGGYLQTGLVHTRHPLRTARRMGPMRWLCFILMMIGTPVTYLLNPVFLGLSVAYVVTGSQYIDRLFPAAVYYPATMLLVIGNFGILYELVRTCLEEAERTRGRFGLIRYMFFAQVMWLWMSRSTYIAVFEFITGRRGWHKTPHGHEVPDDDDIFLHLPAQQSAHQAPHQPSYQPAYAAETPVSTAASAEFSVSAKGGLG
ncbi:hypothetical protein GCM10009839_01030 [Catenulispora yoronensis]|uniref:Glycosyltransferase 2-like domain-containing protein n=1 Tax=Catenulispora yoronensis TaxID=450799 RepID=A0ABP5EXH1_9ACTN